MDKATNHWFKRLNEDRYDVLNEAQLEDFGLPDIIVKRIRASMHDAGNKAQIWLGNQWKEQVAHDSIREKAVFEVIDHWVDDFISELPVEKRSEGNPDFKKAKFIIQNIKGAMTSTQPGSNGRIGKALRKADKAIRKNPLFKEVFGDELDTKADDFMDTVRLKALKHNWNQFFALNNDLINFLKQDPTNYEYFKDKDIGDEVTIEVYDRETRSEEEVNFLDANSYAEYLLSNVEFPDRIIKHFDDGFYWYDLKTNKCSVEGERMGHCGADDRGTLYSLRYKKKGKKWSSSMVTVSADDDTIYQIKGRDNNAPDEDTWKHIAWFIDNMDIETVKESGEHSDDREGISEMIEYLRLDTEATFEGSLEDRADALQEELEEITRSYNNAFENDVWIQASEVTVEDDYMYYYADGGVEFNIPLGWKDVAHAGNTWFPNNEEERDKYYQIPEHWPRTEESRAFETGLDEAFGFTPEETEWEVSDDAILTVKFRFSCDDCGSDDSDPYDSWAYWVQTDVDEKYEEIKKKMHRWLADEEYTAPREWPKTIKKLAQFAQTLENFYADLDPENEEDDLDESDHIRFWLSEGGTRQDTTIETDIVIPPDYFSKLGIQNGSIAQSRATAKIFGGRPDAGSIPPSPKFQQDIQAATQKLEQAAQKAADRQLVLPGMPSHFYRREYKSTQFAESSMVRITADLIRRETEPSAGFYPMRLGYRYTIDFEEATTPEQIKGAMAFMEYMDRDNNVEHLKKAIEETMRDWVQDAIGVADMDYKSSISSRSAKELISRIIDTYTARLPNDRTTRSQERINLARWADENFEKMNDVEKRVLITQYLTPVAVTGAGVNFEPEEGDEFPANWVPRVRSELERLGHPSPRDYKADMYQESVEEQIERLDRLLNEEDPNYDLRMYKIRVTCSVDKDIGGTDLETEHEIRGVWGVTTVEPDAKTKRKITPSAIALVYSIKFKLHGQENRQSYVNKVLIPGMRKIKGLRVLRIAQQAQRLGAPSLRESSVLQEFTDGSASGFGGVASNLAAQRDVPLNVMPTPRPSLKDIIDDWVDGGVQMYDAPVDSTDMRYSVMMPVEELMPLVGASYRGTPTDFKGRYQHFIANGPDAPVYVAIGKNGRAKISGNEDIVLFAKEAGLEEVPIFLSYQRQV